MPESGSAFHGAELEIISSLSLDFSQAIEATKTLDKHLESLSSTLKGLKDIAAEVGTTVGQAIDSLAKRAEESVARSVSGAAGAAGGGAGRGGPANAINELLRIERDIQQAIAKAQRLGFDPHMLEQQLDNLRVVAALYERKAQLSEEDVQALEKSLTAIREQVSAQALQIQATEKTIEAERTRTDLVREIADHIQRAGVAAEDAQRQAAQAAMALQAQLTNAQRVAEQHRIGAEQSGVTGRNIQEQLNYMRETLDPIAERARASGIISEEEVKTLNAIEQQYVIVKEAIGLAQREAQLSEQRSRTLARMTDDEVKRHMRARETLATLDNELGQMQLMAERYGVLNEQSAQHGRSIGGQLTLMREQVQALTERLVAQAHLSEIDTARIQQLKHEARILRNSEALARAIAKEEERRTIEKERQAARAERDQAAMQRDLIAARERVSVLEHQLLATRRLAEQHGLLNRLISQEEGTVENQLNLAHKELVSIHEKLRLGEQITQQDLIQLRLAEAHHKIAKANVAAMRQIASEEERASAAAERAQAKAEVDIARIDRRLASIRQIAQAEGILQHLSELQSTTIEKQLELLEKQIAPLKEAQIARQQFTETQLRSVGVLDKESRVLEETTKKIKAQVEAARKKQELYEKANAAARKDIENLSETTLEMLAQVKTAEDLKIKTAEWRQEIRNAAETYHKEIVRLISVSGDLTEDQIRRVNALKLEVAGRKEALEFAIAEATQTRRHTEEQLKQRRSAELTLLSLQRQLVAAQRKINYQRLNNKLIRDENTTFGARIAMLREEVELLLRRLKAEQATTRQIKEQAISIQERLTSLNQAIVLQSRVVSEIESMARRRLSWFFTGTILFGGMAALRRMSDQIKEIEMSMVLIQRVMTDPLFNLEEMRRGLFDLAQQFGFTFDVVAEVATRWAQTGMNMVDTLEATRVSLLGLNTAEMDTEAATTSLIGIMSAWELQARDLELVIDKLNITSDRFPVTTQDLIDALLRTSGTARAAGMSLEELLGVIVAVREASGRAGREVGNALNTILSFVQRDIFLQTAEALGIAVFEDATSGKLRPILDVIADIADRWEDADAVSQQVVDSLYEQAEAAGLITEEVAELVNAHEAWTDLQRRDLIQSAAQTRRRQFLLALLRNFKRVQDVVLVTEQALGHSMRQNEETMETYEKKVNQLHAAWSELIMILAADSGGLDILKEVTEGLRGGIEAFNRLPESVRKSIFWLALLTSALTAVNFGLRTMVGQSIIEGIKALVAGLQSITSASIMSGLSGLSTAIFSPLGAAVMSVAIGVGLLASRWAMVTQEARAAAEALAATRAEIEGNIIELEAQVEVHNQSIAKIRAISTEYREIQRQMAEADDERVSFLEARQHQLVTELRAYVNEEEALMLERAQFHDDAVNIIIEAERQRQRATLEALNAAKEALRDHMDEQIAHTLVVLKTLEEQQEGWDKYLTFWEHARMFMGLVGKFIARGLLWLVAEVESFIDRIATGIGKLLVWINEVSGGLFPLASDSPWRAIAKGAEESFTTARDALDALDAEIQDVRDRISEMAAERHRDNLKDLVSEYRYLAQAAREGGDEAGRTAGEFSGVEDAASKAASATRSLTQSINDYIDAIARSHNATKREIDLLEARIKYLTREGAELHEIAQADQDRARLLELLIQRQKEMHIEAQAARDAALSLREEQARLNTATESGAAAFTELAKSIDQLEDRANRLGVEWWNIQARIKEISEVSYQVAQDFQRAMDDIAYYSRLGVMTLEEHIARLRRAVSDFSSLTVDQQMRYIEEQSRVYRALLAQERDRIEEAYRARIEAVKAWADAEIAERQRLIEELDEEQEAEDREEAERKHLETMEELQKEYRYHELRTGRQHLEAMEEIQKKMQEEIIRWELQQERWRREDKKRSLQQEIEDIRQRAQEQEKIWQEAWERVRNEWNDHNIAMLAMAAAYDPDWFERGRSIADHIIAGFMSGDVEGVISASLARAAKAGYSSTGGKGSGKSQRERDLELLKAKQEWEAAYARGDTAGMAAAAAKGEKIRASGPTSDPYNNLSASQLKKILGLQEGGMVLGQIIATLGERGTKELVLPVDKAAPFFVDAMRLAMRSTLEDPLKSLEAGLARVMAPIERRLTQILKVLESGALVAKFDNLMNIENYHGSNTADIDNIVRQLGRKVFVNMPAV